LNKYLFYSFHHPNRASVRIKLYSEVRKSLKKEIVSLVLFFVMVYVGLLGVKDNHCISRPCRL